MDIQEKIEQLARRISQLSQHQSNLSRQLIELINELEALKKKAAASDVQPVKTIEYTEPIIPPVHNQQPKTQNPEPKTNSSFEEFVGKNLASKVGILVTIVGIFIGARYAIEHNLVSPVVRIISGYLSGLTLIILALFLRKKYEAYSSVLMGGGLAVLYFITYTAYGFYNLVPQLTAFILMLIFTVASVYVSLLFNRVIIAHLGLVGAYAIPFLLSDNSGRYLVLFSYIAIINAGILVLSFLKYWKSLFYSAFIFTWLIYGAWHLSYNDAQHFTLAFTFRSVFFALFYFTFLSYKLVKKEKFGGDAVAIILSNSFIFYAFGYDALSESGSGNTGLFTIINAVIHFGVSQLVRSKLADRALYYLVFGLTIVFITIAIPVQFDGNWVTLLWTAEAVLMFAIGRTQGAAPYEKLSVGLILLALISLVEDWTSYYTAFEISGNEFRPFSNIVFITGLLVSAAAGGILYLSRNKKFVSSVPEGNIFRSYFPYVIAIIFLLITYLSFFLEIHGYFNHFKYREAAKDLYVWMDEKGGFTYMALLLYSMIFANVVVAVNRLSIKSNELTTASLAAIALLAIIFLAPGLRLLHGLSQHYYKQSPDQLIFGAWDVLIRYLVMGAMILLLWQGREAAKIFGERSWTKKTWQLLIHTIVLAMLSAEYLHLTGISGDGGQYKLGLSILWGMYALFLIVWGIYKKQKHLRLAAIVLFVITLVKLFVYDLDESGTVTKTVSFISLGAILLLVSYLYNRYKEVLFGKDE